MTIPAVADPRHNFADDVEPIKIALQQERRVTDQISGLAKAAREEGDLVGEQFVEDPTPPAAAGGAL